MSITCPHYGEILRDQDDVLSWRKSYLPDKASAMPLHLSQRELAVQSRNLPYPVGNCDPSDLWRRIVSALIDGCFWGMLLLIFDIFTGVPRHSTLCVVLFCVIALCYLLVMERSSTQATLGQMIMGITGCEEDGQPISLTRTWARLVKCASVMAMVFGFLVTFFLARTPLLNR